MTLTVKLEPGLERALARRSEERGVPKSVVVKEALAEHLAREPASAYEVGKDLFGRQPRDLPAVAYEQHLLLVALHAVEHRAEVPGGFRERVVSE